MKPEAPQSASETQAESELKLEDRARVVESAARAEMSRNALLLLGQYPCLWWKEVPWWLLALPQTKRKRAVLLGLSQRQSWQVKTRISKTSCLFDCSHPSSSLLKQARLCRTLQTDENPLSSKQCPSYTVPVVGNGISEPSDSTTDKAEIEIPSTAVSAPPVVVYEATDMESDDEDEEPTIAEAVDSEDPTTLILVDHAPEAPSAATAPPTDDDLHKLGEAKAA